MRVGVVTFPGLNEEADIPGVSRKLSTEEKESKLSWGRASDGATMIPLA